MTEKAGVDTNMNSTECEDAAEMALCPHIEDKENALRKMVQTNYGLTVTSMKPLNGYEDMNYHFCAEPTFSNPQIDEVRPEGYFLKISNIVDSRRPELLYAQRAAMDHLAERGIAVQDAIKGLNGDVFTHITSPDQNGEILTYVVSLRNYLPGDVIASITITDRLLYNVGAFAGKVAQHLTDFRHPVYDTFNPLWSMNNVYKVSEVVFAVQDEKMKKMSEDVLKAYETEVMPIRGTFRKGHIHGDLNNHNILIVPDASGSPTEVSGLLDFQDSGRSYPLYDIAILIAYMMMCGDSDVPLEDVPGHVLAGYTSVVPLPDSERAVLKTCLAARMVQSLAYGAYSYYRDPTNEYVLDTAKFGWKALAQLWEVPSEALDARWSSIINSYKK